MWKDLIQKIRENSKAGRELNYSENSIGITALLHCPLKWELSRTYEIEASAVEIDDGFVWEGQVKSVLRELYSDRLEEEKDLIWEVDGYRLHGHLDVFIEKEDEVIGIELKAPKYLLLKAFPQDVEDGLLIDNGIVIHNPVYLKQASIEKFLLDRLYEKPVRMYLFYKALCKYKNYTQKLYVVSEVRESITEEELKSLIRAFHEDRSPRYPSECESYCAFYRAGVCEGKPYQVREEKATSEVMELLKQYRSLQTDLKLLETNLKKAIRGTISLNGKQIGWVRKQVKEVDLKKVLERVENPEEYLTVKWQRKEELIERLGEDVVKEVRELVEWRL